MSDRLLQFPPEATSRVIRMSAIPAPWSTPSTCSSEDVFLNSLLEDDDSGPKRTNWGAISGMALAIGVSAGCWTAVALAIGRIWR